MITSNQGRFDEGMYPYRNQDMVDKNVDDLSNVDALTLDQEEIEWIKYSADMDLNKIEKVHSGGSSDSYIMSPDQNITPKCTWELSVKIYSNHYYQSVLMSFWRGRSSWRQRSMSDDRCVIPWNYFPVSPGVPPIVLTPK